MLDEMDRVRGSRIVAHECESVSESVGVGGGGGSSSIAFGGRNKNPCRISPSPNHVTILELMHRGGRSSATTMASTATGGRVVRQLLWNAACGVDADPWFDGGCSSHLIEDDERYWQCARRGDDNDEPAPTTATTMTTMAARHGRGRRMRRRKKNHDGDGRYVPIDALDAARSALPDHSPLLTNVKRRLPMRSDVGFANPDPEEVRIKMDEVRREAEWEESSPRIVLLGSGFMLFSAAADDDDDDDDDDGRKEGGDEEDGETTKEADDDGSLLRPSSRRVVGGGGMMETIVVDRLHSSCREDVRIWAGGGSIPGVPFAGRDLVSAYLRERIAFGKSATRKKMEDIRGGTEDGNEKDATTKDGDSNNKVVGGGGKEGGRIKNNAVRDVGWFAFGGSAMKEEIIRRGGGDEDEEKAAEKGNEIEDEGGRHNDDHAAAHDADWFHHHRARDPGSYSVFAPPVDAIFSEGHHWRPRPFTDRPPGHVYFLACPVDIRLGREEDDNVPLFCTMALYTLPKVRQRRMRHPRSGDCGELSITGNNKDEFRGKISEDFFFPAGDWFEIEGGGGGSFDDEDDEGKDEGRHQSWRRRKRRAIMSYDPLEISPRDLYLVIQVHRANSPPNNESTGANSRPRKSIIGSILNGKFREEDLSVMAECMQHQQIASSASLEEVGVQYLVPVCFSITPAFVGKNGVTQQKRETTSFFAFPDAPESHEDFVTRLACIANSPSSSPTKSTPMSCAYSDVFTSYLGGDFMRTLLDEPPPQLFRGDAHDDDAPLGLQLLADVTGDCAVSYDGPTSRGATRRRSNLRRLPPSQESGYASSFDLKEVLYFPPRSLPRNYEDDSAIASSTVLNLFYIYPRLIRRNSSRVGDKSQAKNWGSDHLTIRIQVVEQELPLDLKSYDNSDPTYQALQAVYNVSSPAGPPLVESFFTKLVKNRTCDKKIHSKTETSQIDIPLKDEVKVRLPDILDRRHFLLFTLFAVRGDGDVEQMANTAIPFIISSKSVSGTRVTTVIPNGLHRIQLSDGIQLHVETRLASSFHVSDPKVATLLRDYPLLVSDSANCRGSAQTDADSSSSASDVIVHAFSGSTFLDILTITSGQAVKRHFLCLVTSNMLNLLNLNPSFYFEQIFGIFGGGDSEWHRLVACEKSDALLAIIRSLFEILDKTRTSYQERDCCMLSLQYLRLVKSFLDAFDEQLFEHRLSTSDDKVQYSGNVPSLDESHVNESQDSSHVLNDDCFSDGPSSSLTKSKDDQRRIARYTMTSPKNDMLTKSFSRKAFVATRIEQLKAEAELNDADEYHVRDFFEDDETVMTFGTTLSKADSMFPLILESRSFSVETQDEMFQSKSSSIETYEEAAMLWTCGAGVVSTKTPRRSTTQTKISTPFSFSTKRAEDMANRVARIVIAPCIAPSLDDMTPCHSANGTLNNGKSTASQMMVRDDFNSKILTILVISFVI
jgi:hypothetical protein